MNKFKFIYFLAFLILCLFAIAKVFVFAFDFPVFYNPPPFSPKEKQVFLKFLEDFKDDFALKGESFLEADLQAMRISFFKDGVLEREFPIQAKGDPQNWGGSAAGIYEILSGNKASFSNIAEVFMPYALHYFGKYYIHGEPYSADGGKINSPVSGGCLRLNDEDAEQIYQLSDIGMPFLVIDKSRDDFKYVRERIVAVPDGITSSKYLLADLDSGFIFLEKNSKNPASVSSIADLMEALVVSENVNLERGAVQLFYPLLMESSEKSREDLYGFLGKTKTLELMNEKAKSILMQNTFFSGQNSISTPQDLFYLAQNIQNNRSLLWLVSRGKRVRLFGDGFLDLSQFKNNNLSFGGESFVGGKTSYSENQDGVFVFNLNNRNIALVILDSVDIEGDAKDLYQWVLNSYFY